MTDHQKKEKRDNEPEAGMPEAKAGEGENSAAEQPQPEEMELLPEDDLESLKAELEGARAKGAEYFEGWQRERADFANFRRRVERDQAQTYQNLQGGIIKKFLPVLDDLNRALKARPTEGDAAAWASGIELISRKLQAILESEGVQRMPAETELFDPSRHEAISLEDSSDHQSGQIIEVIQDGYLLGDRVLRPALVRVAR